MTIDAALIKRAISGALAAQHDGEYALAINPALSEPIEAHPERTSGKAPPLRDKTGGAQQRRDPMAAMAGFLRVAHDMEKSFAEGGVLQAALAAARGQVLLTLRDDPEADRIALCEDACSALAEGLPVLWRLAPSQELAGLKGELGALWSERLSGDRADNLEAAIGCYQAALQFYGEGGTPADWARIKNNLGVAFSDRLLGDHADNLEAAIECHLATLRVYGEHSTPHDWAMTQNNLGAAYRNRLRGNRDSNMEAALECYGAALRVYNEHDTPRDWAMTQNNLGIVYRNRLRGDRISNLEDALKCYQAALRIYSEDESPHQWATIQNNLGATYNERVYGDRSSNLEAAIECYQASLRVFTEHEAPYQWARTQINLGAVYNDRLRGDQGANQETAIACYDAALRVYSENDTPYQWSSAQNNLGNAHSRRLLGDRSANLEAAIECYRAALRGRREQEAPYQWAMTQSNLGVAYGDRLGGDRSDNLESAIACYQAALRVRTKHDTPHDWIATLTNLGVAYNNRILGDRESNLGAALECYYAALPLLHRIDSMFALHVLVAIGQLHRELGRDDLAGSAWHEALSLRERLLSAGTSLATRADAAQRSRDLVISLALLEHDRDDAHAAAEVLERGRAAALRTALELDDIWLDSLPGTTRVPIVQARDLLDRLRAAPPSATEGADPALMRGWEADIANTHTALDAALAAAQEAGGFRPPSPLDADGLAALAPDGGALLLLAAGPDRGLACVVPHRPGTKPPMAHTVPLPLATDDAVRTMLRDWLDAHNGLRGTLGNARTYGQQRFALLAANTVLEGIRDRLWQTVMEPVLRHPDAAEMGLAAGMPLVLLPHGDLAMLPLHAAGPAGDGTRRAVLDEHVVSYAPSGAVLRAARQRLAALPAGQRSLFGLFNPMRGTKDALRFAETVEMPALTALFGSAARTYVGAEASVGRVLALPPQPIEAAYVHFACHGSFAADDPEQSGLQLADDRRLTVQDIVRQLRLSANRWVALSACETAMVDVQQLPDEFVGLPAAFLQAGAPGVIATLWSVYDQPTVRLMPRVYQQHLTKGSTPAAALREAVLWLRQQTDTTLGHSQISDDTFGFGGPPEGKPEAELQDPTSQPSVNLYSLPIIWAAYSYHGV